MNAQHTPAAATNAHGFSHVAQPHRCYVGDEVSLLTRVPVRVNGVLLTSNQQLLLTIQVQQPHLLVHENGQPAPMPVVFDIQPHPQHAWPNYATTRLEPTRLDDGLSCQF